MKTVVPAKPGQELSKPELLAGGEIDFSSTSETWIGAPVLVSKRR